MSELRWLRAGPLDAALDGPDLRYVRFGGVELVRRVYVAVRDLNWDTIGAVERDVSVDDTGDAFSIRSRMRHRRGSIDFRWEGAVEAQDDGTITYAIDGTCESAFDYARIGICVHHPTRECAGRPYRALTPERSLEGVLPLLIAPQLSDVTGGYELPLFDPFSALSIELENGTGLEFSFDGDLFEMEDQRNWTDASFKTVSTPSYLGYQHTAVPGQRITQRVVMRFRPPPGQSRTMARPRLAPAERAVLTLGEPLGRRLPPIGFGLPSDDPRHTDRERARVKALRPAHLRADIKRGGFEPLKDALELCAEVGAELELAVHVDPGRIGAIQSLAQPLALAGDIARVLVFQSNALTTPRDTIEAARRDLPSPVPLVGGTDANFCDINRDRPDVMGLDGIAYSINSQVHAFDELSLVEALAGHADTVISARELFPGVPIVVSPVTLRPRFNPAAIGDGPARAEGELPPDVDPRQMTRFGAVWTLGSIKALSESGASSLTYYETVGWRGLFERDAGNPMPGSFLSKPGMVFPMYELFAALTDLAEAELVSFVPTDPLAVTGLAFRTGETLQMVIGNLTDQPLTVSVAPIDLRVRLEGYEFRRIVAPESEPRDS
jgi:D-apionolactonase